MTSKLLAAIRQALARDELAREQQHAAAEIQSHDATLTSRERYLAKRLFQRGLEQGYRPCYSKDVAKVTSKLQVTVPKAVADRYGIRPGDEIEWLALGDTIRVIPPGKKIKTRGPDERLRRFDLATARQRKRNKRLHAPSAQSRGWSREDLYRRGRTR